MSDGAKADQPNDHAGGGVNPKFLAFILTFLALAMFGVYSSTKGEPVSDYEAERIEKLDELRSEMTPLVADIDSFTESDLNRVQHEACKTSRSAATQDALSLAFVLKWEETPSLHADYRGEMDNYISTAGSALAIYCPEDYPVS